MSWLFNHATASTVNVAYLYVLSVTFWLLFCELWYIPAPKAWPGTMQLVVSYSFCTKTSHSEAVVFFKISTFVNFSLSRVRSTNICGTQINPRCMFFNMLIIIPFANIAMSRAHFFPCLVGYNKKLDKLYYCLFFTNFKLLCRSYRSFFKYALFQ